MLYYPRPAGDPGRPSRRAWLLPLVQYGLGYAVGLFVTGAGGVIFLSRFHLRPDDIPFTLPWLCLSVPLWWYILGNVTPLTRRWEQAVILRRTSTPYLVCVGVVAGSAVAIALLGVMYNFHHTVSEAVAAGLLAGPLAGIWWILLWRQRPSDTEGESYDEMTPAERHIGTTLLELPDLAATEAFGRRLGGLLFPNAVVALVGPLGAGKTHLSRAIAEGLDIANPAAVTSPTFTLIHEYPARLPVYHFDAYRLNGSDEFLDLGATEYYEAGGVCLIEWADKVEAALPDERLTIRLVPLDETRRRAEVSGVGAQYERLVRELASGPA